MICFPVEDTSFVPCSRNTHITEAFRMQMEVQRRIHEQLEVTYKKKVTLTHKFIIYILYLLVDKGAKESADED